MPGTGPPKTSAGPVSSLLCSTNSSVGRDVRRTRILLQILGIQALTRSTVCYSLSLVSANNQLTVWQRWVRQPQKIWLRRALFQVHLWSGIAVGLYILMISVTGSVLVYRNELYRAATPEPIISKASGPRLTDDQLAADRPAPVSGLSSGENRPDAKSRSGGRCLATAGQQDKETAVRSTEWQRSWRSGPNRVLAGRQSCLICTTICSPDQPAEK